MKINKEVFQIIEQRMRLYEKIYNIQVLVWSFRGSMDIGIYRKNSDLDIVFIYRSVDKNVRAIHDIVGHGFDYWGWLLDDALTTVRESNKICNRGISYVLSKEHERGSLDYYFGIFCGIDNELSFITESFSQKCVEALRTCCNKKALIVWFNNKLEKIYTKITIKKEITGNEYLYAVWYAYMSKHLMMGNKSGDNKLKKLLDLYATPIEKEEIVSIHDGYKISESKNTKKYFSAVINEIIINQYGINQEYVFSENTCDDCQNEYEKALEVLERFAAYDE